MWKPGDSQPASKSKASAKSTSAAAAGPASNPPAAPATLSGATRGMKFMNRNKAPAAAAAPAPAPAPAAAPPSSATGDAAAVTLDNAWSIVTPSSSSSSSSAPSPPLLTVSLGGGGALPLPRISFGGAFPYAETLRAKRGEDERAERKSKKAGAVTDAEMVEFMKRNGGMNTKGGKAKRKKP